MPVNNPREKRHKRNRSSGDLTKDQIDELATLLDVIEKQVQELKNNKKYGDLEEVQQLVNETADVFAQVKRFKELKSRNPDAMVISLSNMDHDTLKSRLGMGDPILVATGDSPQDFLVDIHKALRQYHGPCEFNIIQKTVMAWDCSPLLSLLTMYTKDINDCSEAAARIIIDPWITSGMQLVKMINDKYRTVLFPELLVWSLRSKTDPPPIFEYNANTTYLAGTIDYVTLNYHLPDELDALHLLAVDQEIDKVVKGENAVRALRLFTCADSFTICEAKRRSKNLYEHEPQVVAECLALSRKLKSIPGFKTQFSITKVGFTLTTGVVWIFGLVDTEKCQYSKTAEIKIDLAELKNQEKASQCLRALMILILIWGTQSGDILEVIMTSIASSGV